MNRLKSLYISSYVTLAFASVAFAIYMLTTTSLRYQPLGALVANLPIAALMAHLFLVKTLARTSANLFLPIAISAAGAAITLYGLSVEPLHTLLVAASLGVGLCGLLIYVFWYSRFEGRNHSTLSVGQTLPEFELEDDNGLSVSSSQFSGKPALWIFYRGNWCPLCMAQIKEVASQYQALAERGIEVILISPQPHKQTASLAQRFDVPFHFLVDKDNRAAKHLQIDSIGGTPFGMEVFGYDSDTVMPTVLITDRNSKLIFADLTDNYRVRPEPDTFIRVLDEHGVE